MEDIQKSFSVKIYLTSAPVHFRLVDNPGTGVQLHFSPIRKIQTGCLAERNYHLMDITAFLYIMNLSLDRVTHREISLMIRDCRIRTDLYNFVRSLNPDVTPCFRHCL